MVAGSLRLISFGPRPASQVPAPGEVAPVRRPQPMYCWRNLDMFSNLKQIIDTIPYTKTIVDIRFQNLSGIFSWGHMLPILSLEATHEVLCIFSPLCLCVFFALHLSGWDGDHPQNSRVQPEGCATILTWPVAGPTWSNDRNRNITTSKMEFLVKMGGNGGVLPPCLSASCLLTFRWKGSTLVSQMMAICGEFTIHIDDMWQTATCDNEQGSITFKWVTL